MRRGFIVSHQMETVGQGNYSVLGQVVLVAEHLLHQTSISQETILVPLTRKEDGLRSRGLLGS